MVTLGLPQTFNHSYALMKLTQYKYPQPPSRLSLHLVCCSYFSLIHVSVVGTADSGKLPPPQSLTLLMVQSKIRELFYQVRSCLVTEEAHVCLTFTFHRLTQFVILYSGGPAGVANIVFKNCVIRSICFHTQRVTATSQIVEFCVEHMWYFCSLSTKLH